MPYNTKAIKRDMYGAPIPQYWDEVADDFVPIEGVDGGNTVYWVSRGSSSSDSQTRPNDTTAYTAGDVVGENPASVLTFANVGVAGKVMAVLGARIRLDINAIPAGLAGFILHLYNAAPTAIADNAAYNLPAADRDKHVGMVAVVPVKDAGDTVLVYDDNLNTTFKLASTTLYGVLETIGAFTPVAQAAITVTINVSEV